MAMVSACAMQRSAASSARAGMRCSTRLAAPRPVLASKHKGRSSSVRVSAILGGGPETDKPPAKKLLREEEPEEYWSAASEKAGANPMKDPVAIIGVVAILFPFVFVAIAIATGAIDISVYK